MSLTTTEQRWMLAGLYALAIAAFFLLNRKKPVKAQAVFLFQQVPTWLFGILVVEAGWIEYPVREFQNATHTSFLFEFLAFPVYAAYFVCFFPERSGTPAKLLYYAAFSLGIVLPEVWIKDHTQLIKYVSWHWYYTFISIWCTLWFARLCCRWFFDSREAAVSNN